MAGEFDLGLLDVNARCSLENLRRDQYAGVGMGRIIGVPGRQLGFLIVRLVYAFVTACDILPRASRTWPERSVPSGSVKDTISLYRGNLTYPPYP